MARTIDTRTARYNRLTSHHLRRNIGATAEPAHFVHDPQTGAYQGIRNAPLSTAPTAFYLQCAVDEQERLDAALSEILNAKVDYHGAGLTTVGSNIPVTREYLR